MKLRSAFAARASLVLGLVAGFSLAAVFSGPGRLVAQRTPGTVVGKAAPKSCASLLAEAARTQAGFINTGVPPALDPAIRESVHAASLERVATDRLVALPGEVIVQFRAGTSTAQRERVLASLRERPALDAIGADPNFLRLFDPGRADPDVLARTLTAHPEVEFATPNHVRRAPGVDVSAVQETSASPRTTQPKPSPHVAGQPLIVAVVGTGVASMPFTLAGRLWTGQVLDDVQLLTAVSPSLTQTEVLSPRDMALTMSGPYADLEGHGSALAARLVSAVPGIRVLPVKACTSYWDLMLRRGWYGDEGFVPAASGGCADSDVAGGILDAVRHGAHVVGVGVAGAEQSPAVRGAAAEAVRQGVVVVLAGSGPAAVGAAADDDPPTVVDGVLVARLVRPLPTARVRLNPFDVSPAETTRPRFDRYADVVGIGGDEALMAATTLAVTRVAEQVRSPVEVERLIQDALFSPRSALVIE